MICVYDIGNTRYEGNGDAVLQPTECKLRNVAGGGYDLTMTHPIDREGKWKHLVPGAVIKSPVPREEIENAFSGYEADVYKVNTDTALREGMSEPTAVSYRAWQASSWTYVVGDKCTYINKNYVCILSDPKTDMMYNHPPDNYPMYWKEIPRYTTGAPVLVTLPAGAELYFVQDVDGTWYKMSTYYGIVGYVKKSQLTFYRHMSQTETLPRIITEQLFRVEKPTVDTKAGTVTVNANHISYDLAAILVKNVSIAQASPAMAIGRITEAFMMEYRGTIATNLTAEDNGTYTQNIKGKNGMFALLDPDKGIVSTFDAAFKRDNWDLFVLKRTETDSGYKIRYRKNMLGVNWAQDSGSLVTRVVPVAKDANGDDLYLPEKWVDSSRIGDYPVIRMEYLTVSGQVGKDDGTGTDTVWTEEALLAEMRTKAAERFSVDRADRVGVTVTVDFEQYGATDEYPEYRGMENVLLYDTVTVENEEIGLSVQLYVSEWEWDAIRRKTTAVKLINAMNYQKGTVAGYSVQAKSISSDKLTDDVAAEILSAARDMIPEYQDSGSYGPTLANTKENAGIVAKGSGNAGKVWKTDDQGNPAWRDEQTVTGFIPTSEKGAANGVATLDSGGKVPASELPSYVDDVVEYASKSNFPATGESGKIYVAKDTGKTYRWSGSAYVELSSYDEATQSASGLMSAADKTKLDGIEAQANKYVLPQASSSALGGIKTGWTGSGKDYPVELDSNGKAHVQVPWTDNNTTYVAGTGISISGNNNAIAVQTGYTASGKNYPVQAGTGGLYVNVPWTADGGNAATVNGKTVGANVPADAVFTDHQYSAGTGLSLSSGAFSVKLGYTTANKKYKVQADTNGNLYVDVPWTDTPYSLPLAADGTRGGIQIGYTQSGKNYPVQLSSEKAYVNVPWENTWRGIQNNLTSDSTTDSLSAAQGKALANGSARDNTKLPLAGGTMTGRIFTSFKASVATGSFQATSNTIPDLVNELRYSSGCVGSANITTDYTLSGSGVTIPKKWYNFFYSPHRSGGVNGAASQDNCDYGSLLLSGMTNSGCYMIRLSAGSIAEVRDLYKDTTYTAGTGLSLSNGQFAVRLAYSTSGKNYKVQADTSGNLYVNVPWENTIYSAGAGIGLSGTTFSNAGVRSVSLYGDYLRVNTNGTNADLMLNYSHNGVWGKFGYHDLFAFCRAADFTLETTTNGTTWTAATLDKAVFDQKNMTSQHLFLNGITGYRWTNNTAAYAWSSGFAILTSWKLGSQTPTRTIKVETSADKSTWTQRALFENITVGAGNHFGRIDGYAGNGYIRITITKTSDGDIPLANLRLLSARPGDQGFGSEYEYPYDWDANRNITLVGALYATGNGTQDIGSSSQKFKDVYANTFNGNATTATAATRATNDAAGYDIRLRYVNVFNNSNVDQDQNASFAGLAAAGNAVGMIHAAEDNPHGSATWTHAISFCWTKGTSANWVSQIAVGVGDGMWYRSTSGNIAGLAWNRLLDSKNYNDYAPKKDGTGATGTWGISITGSASNAATAVTATTATTATTASAPKFEEVTIASGASYSITFPANSIHYMMHASNAGCFKVDIFTTASDTWYAINERNQNFVLEKSGRTFTVKNQSSYSAVVRLGKYYE